MGNAYLTSIVSEDPANPLPSLQQKASTLVLYNKHQDYKLFMVPALLALFVSSFGLTISNFSSNMQQAVFVMWFFIVFLMLLSGLFTPVRSMPMWAYATTYINPMHYFIDAIRTVYIRGGGFREIYPHLIALSLLGSAMSLCAVTTYRKNEK